MRKEIVNKYIFTGNASADVIMEITNSEEAGDNLKGEAVFLHQLLYDNLPGETYEELVRRMKKVSE